MFSFDPKPQKEFCTQVAKLLVKKFTFMRDVGLKVSGYVSYYTTDQIQHLGFDHVYASFKTRRDYV